MYGFKMQNTQKNLCKNLKSFNKAFAILDKNVSYDLPTVEIVNNLGFFWGGGVGGVTKTGSRGEGGTTKFFKIERGTKNPSFKE